MSGRKYSCREQFAVDIAKLIIFCYYGRSYGVTGGELFRTNEQQAIHVKAGRSKVKVSQHQKRLAIDLHLWSIANPGKYISDKEWIEVGEYWESLNPKNRWGGFWKGFYDPNHFERRS